jgi:hypothetical protein
MKNVVICDVTPGGHKCVPVSKPHDSKSYRRQAGKTPRVPNLDLGSHLDVLVA